LQAALLELAHPILIEQEQTDAFGQRLGAFVVVAAAHDVDVGLVEVHDPRRVRREVHPDRQDRECEDRREDAFAVPRLCRLPGAQPQEREQHGEQQEACTPLHAEPEPQ